MHRYLICILIMVLLYVILPLKGYGLNRSYDESIINDNNLLTSILVYERSKLGDIDVYANRNGVFVAISSIPQHLGYDLQIDVDGGLITGTNYLGQSFILDNKSNSYFVNGFRRSFQPNLLVISNQELYMDLDLFNRIFPITATYNYQDLSLSLRPDSDLSDTNKERLIYFMQGYKTPPKQELPEDLEELQQQYEASDETKMLQDAIRDHRQKLKDELEALQPIKLHSPFIETQQPSKGNAEPSTLKPTRQKPLRTLGLPPLPSKAPVAKRSEKPKSKQMVGPKFGRSIEPKKKPSVVPKPKRTVGPKFKRALEPKRKIIVDPEPKPSVGPEPKLSVGSEPKLSVGSEPKLSVGPEPKLSVGPEPKLSVGPEPKLSVGPEPKLSVGPEPKLSVGPEPKLSVGPEPKLSVGPEPKLSVGPLAQQGGDDNLVIIEDENLFIMEVVLNDRLTSDTMDVYPTAHGYYVPLSLFLQIMDFPIDVNWDDNIAEGWFIREENYFKLDLNSKTIILGDNNTSYNPMDVVDLEDEIFIHSKLVKEWFGFESKLNKPNMIVELTTDEELPFERRDQRKERWTKLQNKKLMDSSKKYQNVKTDYQRFTWPFVDIDYSNNYDSTLGDFQANYSIRGTKQLFYHTAKFYATGNEDDLLSSLTFKVERFDEDKGLLGPLKASQFAIGDIDSIAFPLVDSSSRGRGVKISNRPINQSDQFDVTSFIGDSKPGWEVELYRNQQLIGFQAIGSDGRYRFIDVPVLYNNNLFRLVFYGPQGQIEEKTEQFLIDNTLLPEGDINYEVSLDEKSKELINVSDRDLAHANEIRAKGQVNYGLTDNITLNSGLAVVPNNDEGTSSYVLAGTKLSFGNMFLNLDSSYNLNEPGWIGRLSVLTAYKGWNIRMEQKLSDDFVSPSGRSENRSETMLNLNKVLSMGLINNLNFGLDFNHDIDNEGNKRQSAGVRLSKSYKGYNFTNNINIQRRPQTNDQINGRLSASSRLFNTNVRGSIDYSLSEQTEIERISATIQRVLSERLNIRLNIIKETASDIPAKVTTSLDWLFDTYKISPELSIEEDGDFRIGFNLNFSLGKDPRNNDVLIRPNSMTSGGLVWAEAFMDDNGNNVLDDEEEIIENAEFRINGHKMSAYGDNIATNIASNRSNIVTLDIASLEDIFLQPSLEGYRVNLVPASLTKLLFPVQESTEIDGTAYFRDTSGITKPLVYVNLELVNQKGEVVNTSSTAFDGFYIFNNVIPGEYVVRVKAEDLKRLSLIKESPVTVSVMPDDDDFYSGYDLYLIRVDSK